MFGEMFVCLALSIHIASSASTSVIPLSSTSPSPSISSSSSSNPSTSTSSTRSSTPTTPTFTQGFLSPKPLSTYEVTENVIDTPDDRPLQPIVANYSISAPLNMINTNISANNNTQNNTEDKVDEIDDTFKKTSLTFIHISSERPEKKEGKIKKILKGIKDYVHGLKVGVVDGLHRFLHRNDDKKRSHEGHEIKDLHLDEFQDFESNDEHFENFSEVQRSHIEAKKEDDYKIYYDNINKSDEYNKKEEYNNDDVFEHEFGDYDIN